MSRKKSPEQLEREAREADEALAAQWRRQQACDHYNAHPAEWHWETGKARLLRCPDCGAENSFEDQA